LSRSRLCVLLCQVSTDLVGVSRGIGALASSSTWAHSRTELSSLARARLAPTSALRPLLRLLREAGAQFRCQPRRRSVGTRTSYLMHGRLHTPTAAGRNRCGPHSGWVWCNPFQRRVEQLQHLSFGESYLHLTLTLHGTRRRRHIRLLVSSVSWTSALGSPSTASLARPHPSPGVPAVHINLCDRTIGWGLRSQGVSRRLSRVSRGSASTRVLRVNYPNTVRYTVHAPPKMLSSRTP